MAMDYTRIIDTILPSGHDKENGGLSDSTIEQGYLLLHADTKQFTAEGGFTNLLGTTNEVNTNIITIHVPKKIEGHEVGNCDNKILKWHNLGSGEKGISELASKGPVDETIHAWQWIIPPEALTQAGNVKIAVSFYDKDTNQVITYQWNSQPYQSLTVAKGMDEISLNPIPADNVITIDLETKKVIIPTGLNSELGKAGEIGLAKLRFRCDRFYRDIDFSNGQFQIVYENAKGTKYYNSVAMLPQINGDDGTTLERRSDLLEFEWNASEAVANVDGDLSFLVLYMDLSKSILWKSEICSYFTIGKSFGVETTINPTTGKADLVISDGNNLKKMLDEFLGEGEAPANSLTTNEAIVYAIQRLIDSEFVFDAGDASEFITE